MEKPFRFIEYKLAHRDEFEVTEGRQPTWALFYLKEGRFRLAIGESEQIIGAGDCAVFPDDVDFTRSVLEPISFLYLKFRVNPRCPFTLPLPVGKIAFRDRARFLSDIETYEALCEAEDSRSLYQREHALEDILLLISAEHAGGSAGAGGDARLRDCHDSLVLEGARCIRSEIDRKWTVDDLCRALSTNPSTLNFRFRRALGCSVGAFLTDERMRAARRFLENTTFPVGEVARRCGFENIYYFSTAFRKNHGISPSEYRKRCRGE
ncbi:MAG: AraC family transcriptional regulator [Clostridia bacterium]|nr:AraC family transcriptional regulator [Clostridia bacterium]